MEQPNLPPELLRIMLEMSGNPEEKDAIEQQLALAALMGKTALSGSESAPSHRIGGAAHAISKGILGYGAARDQAAANVRREAMKEKNITGRQQFLDAMYGKRNNGDSSGFEGTGMRGETGMNIDPNWDPRQFEEFAGYGGTGGF